MNPESYKVHSMKTINPGIFREYDIRGIVDVDLDEEVYETIGKAFGTYVKDHGGKVLSLGRDCRLSSPDYARAMTRGITSTGIDVVDIGMVTTPMLYFSLYNLPVDGGVMITASHNPGEYNGIKLCLGRDSVFGEEIQNIRKIADSGEFHTGSGTASETSVEEKYVEFLKSNVEIKPGLRLAVDYGNGMVGIIGPRVFVEFGCDVKEFYATPDGTFPNHHPDPTVEENVAELAATVAGEGFSLGIGFDGDGDRVGVVDGDGRIIWGDMLVLIYARDVLSRKKGAEIIGDVKCSNRLFEGIEAAGGKPVMWKTGHSLIKNKMKKDGAALAG
ncbi:MAG: phosphomannomutase/phosphoglucomutase, partial [Candidatus Dadabacteria bacterium]|nr:phosphomannomutase/phosphoglucomutase [Candidatus Dadabacteria bacterium]